MRVTQAIVIAIATATQSGNCGRDGGRPEPWVHQLSIEHRGATVGACPCALYGWCAMLATAITTHLVAQLTMVMDMACRLVAAQAAVCCGVLCQAAVRGDTAT